MGGFKIVLVRRICDMSTCIEVRNLTQVDEGKVHLKENENENVSRT